MRIKSPKIEESLVRGFVEESNAIEGYVREAYRAEVVATADFLAKERIWVNDVTQLVTVLTHIPMPLRIRKGMDVQVGTYVAPAGGALVVEALVSLLDHVSSDKVTPLINHVAFENLHPYMDGNGRAGRALWAWQMLHYDHRFGIQLGFLHAFYYQLLDEFPSSRQLGGSNESV